MAYLIAVCVSISIQEAVDEILFGYFGCFMDGFRGPFPGFFPYIGVNLLPESGQTCIQMFCSLMLSCLS